jgi:hypothetical protein
MYAQLPTYEYPSFENCLRYQTYDQATAQYSYKPITADSRLTPNTQDNKPAEPAKEDAPVDPPKDESTSSSEDATTTEAEGMLFWSSIEPVHCAWAFLSLPIFTDHI